MKKTVQISCKLLLFLLLSGCATRIYENGQKVFETYGDCTNITFTTKAGTTFHADSLIHSVPTQVVFTGVNGIVGTAAAGAIGFHAVAPAAALIPATAAAIHGIAIPPPPLP